MPGNASPDGNGTAVVTSSGEAARAPPNPSNSWINPPPDVWTVAQ